MPTSWTNENKVSTSWSAESKVSATTWNPLEKLGAEVEYNDNFYSYNSTSLSYNSAAPATTWTNESKI